MLPAGTVTEALRVWLERTRSGCADGSQLLKSPTTETAPAGSFAGSEKVILTMPSPLGFVVLIMRSPKRPSIIGCESFPGGRRVA